MIMQLDQFLKSDSPEALRKITIDFLEGDGDNAKLARHIKNNQNAEVTFQKLPLKDMVRIIGPDEELPYFENRKEWEVRVSNLVEAIRNGYEPLPLILTNFWGETTLADGNHRHEALIRSGYKTYWAITFLIKS